VTTPKFVIIANKITDDQRSRMHELVKAQGDGWWHHYADAWIVQNHSAAFWRDLLMGIVGETGVAGVLVLELTGMWSAFGPTNQSEWLTRFVRPDL
jgi:hypothetical protein